MFCLGTNCFCCLSLDCCGNKTKVISRANHKGPRQSNEPNQNWKKIHMWLTQSGPKRLQRVTIGYALTQVKTALSRSYDDYRSKGDYL